MYTKKCYDHSLHAGMFFFTSDEENADDPLPSIEVLALIGHILKT
jgi:hypothetical protein